MELAIVHLPPPPLLRTPASTRRGHTSTRQSTLCSQYPLLPLLSHNREDKSRTSLPAWASWRLPGLVLSCAAETLAWPHSQTTSTSKRTLAQGIAHCNRRSRSSKV